MFRLSRIRKAGTEGTRETEHCFSSKSMKALGRRMHGFLMKKAPRLKPSKQSRACEGMWSAGDSGGPTGRPARGGRYPRASSALRQTPAWAIVDPSLRDACLGYFRSVPPGRSARFLRSNLESETDLSSETLHVLVLLGTGSASRGSAPHPTMRREPRVHEESYAAFRRSHSADELH
jgi:hypothetical protein